jgi:hypothetical protein
MPVRSLDFAPEHPLFHSRPVEHPAEVPFALAADAEGNIEEHPLLRCMGRTGNGCKRAEKGQRNPFCRNVFHDVDLSG